MTRATVGGINSEDNLWYPLAVNSQGIAQIDTSGIPQPMEWSSSSFEPVFTSTDPAFTAVIDYNRQLGRIWTLGYMAFFKILIQTNSVIVTNPRGSLVVAGIPGRWKQGMSYLPDVGSSLNTYGGWNNNPTLLAPRGNGDPFIFKLQKLENGVTADVTASDLTEGESPQANKLGFAYWGMLQEPLSVSNPELVFEALSETPEISADTQ